MAASSSAAPIVHIVRRYGPVGGMERYVWELTRTLAESRREVHVVCERVHAAAVPPGIQVHALGETLRRPRWLSHVLFSRRVTGWMRREAEPGWIVHSHERCARHDLTTFHGPPFAAVRDRPLWKRVSLRVAVNFWLERREVMGPGAGMVVPVSSLIGDRLRHYYPDASRRIATPVLPGVVPPLPRPARTVPPQGGVIGFIGYEWKRKGLDRAVAIMRRVLARRPHAEFWVAGAAANAVQALFAGYPGKFVLQGSVDPHGFYRALDLVLHPARQEPFGMVIMEAMAAYVPVLISRNCGAQTEVTPMHGRVLPLDAETEQWADACVELLERPQRWPGYARPWSDVGREYGGLYSGVPAKGVA